MRQEQAHCHVDQWMKRLEDDLEDVEPHHGDRDAKQNEDFFSK